MPDVPGTNWGYWQRQWTNFLISSTVTSCLPVMVNSFWSWIGSFANRNVSAISIALSPYACFAVFLNFVKKSVNDSVVSTTMTNGVIQPKILQTQIPLFPGNRDKYNEFDHLLKNHLRPHMNELTERQIWNIFKTYTAFWQTLKITTETILTDILPASNKEDLRWVSKYRLDQMRYDPGCGFPSWCHLFKVNGTIGEFFVVVAY